MTHYLLDARTATAHFPGIGRYARNLAAALIPYLSGDEHLIILWNPSDPTAWDPVSLVGLQVEIVPAAVSPFALSQQWRVPALLHQRLAMSGQLSFGGRPAGFHRSLYHSTFYLMPYRPGVPTVLTLYDLITMLHPETVSARSRLFFRCATWLALHAADLVITISQTTRRDLLTHFRYPAERVLAIPLAPAPHFCPRSQSEIARVWTKYGLPERYLLYLGINKPHKNLVRLIEAWAQVEKQGAMGCCLVIAGHEDPRYPQARERAAALGLDGVMFLGTVAEDDLPALYSGADLFVFPSLYEGFGLPVIEAMACGTAVACSNISSLPEVAGDAALLFDPHTPETIAATIRQALQDADLRERLRRRGLEQAGHFSWERTARLTLDAYRQACS